MATYPPSATVDARNRAWRTFVQGLGVDVALSGAGALTIAMTAPEFAWSKAYWVGVGLAVAKTVLTTATAYVSRKLKPPQP
jgi:hypothetical protein